MDNFTSKVSEHTEQDHLHLLMAIQPDVPTLNALATKSHRTCSLQFGVESSLNPTTYFMPLFHILKSYSKHQSLMTGLPNVI